MSAIARRNGVRRTRFRGFLALVIAVSVAGSAASCGNRAHAADPASPATKGSATKGSATPAPRLTVPDVNIVAAYGQPASLPSKTLVVSATGRGLRPVTWDPVDRSIFTRPGVHHVRGKLPGSGTSVTGTIKVFPKDWKIAVAAVGDSITYGRGTVPGSRTSYPDQLQAMLGSGFQVGNFGASGTTLLTASTNAYVAKSEYTRSMAWKPDVVVIQLGTNDAQSKYKDLYNEFAANYRELIDSYRSLPTRPLVYVALPPTTTRTGDKITEQHVDHVISLILRALAADGYADVTVIDNNAATSDLPASFLPDGLHPGAEGSLVLADSVRQALVGVRATPANGVYPASSLNSESGMALMPVTDPGKGSSKSTSSLREIDSGDWVSYDQVDLGDTPGARLQLRTATTHDDVVLTVRSTSPRGPVLARAVLPETGSLTAFATLSVPVSQTGTHDLYFSFSRPSPGHEIAALASWSVVRPGDAKAGAS